MPRHIALAVLFLSGSLLWTMPQGQKKKGPVAAATPAESLRLLKDFKAELLYSVPEKMQGSWVNLCVDAKGRLITSDQEGPLYRITPPPLGGHPADTKIETIDLPIGEAQGLLCAFDSLYVVVNGARKYKSGLYRLKDTNGDDKYDKLELLKSIDGVGEHGPHAVMLTPDGKSLTIVCGNGTKMVKPLTSSRVPQHWGEDHLLPRLPDGNGFMANVLGPGGCIYNVDPDGKEWELISTGYRNQFDAAYNRQGELFTYDADMEWDFNTPWYRPTRVNHVTSGSEYGWRNGAGKWFPHYPDSLPAVVNIGPGSPTGVCFGYGAKFPAKYQDAFYILDWSYGKLYAIHLSPHGSSYKGEIEEFVTGTPLPLTDAVINPHDGAMYFTIGGRRTQSGLYRVTYAGKESVAPSKAEDAGAGDRKLRHELESLHEKKGSRAVNAAWPHLDHPDRFTRFAARVALEHQDVAHWQKRALAETSPGKAIAAILALVRVTESDPFHRKPPAPPVVVKGKRPIYDALLRLDWEKLTDEQRLDLLRVWHVTLNRMAPNNPTLLKELTERFEKVYPSPSRELNAELCALLVYLEAPSVASKSLRLMAEAPTQEEQMEYARSLRALETGWTMPQREEYFRWFLKAANFKGGNSLGGFLRKMKADAVATLSEKEKKALQPILDAKPLAPEPIVGKARPVVKEDKPDELKAWLDELGNPYTAIADDAKGRTAIDLGVSGAPETFVVDKKGRIRYKQVGAIDDYIWEHTLEPMIKTLEAEP